MTIEYDHATINLLISLRGVLPEKCDFCNQQFTGTRYPLLPEEAGAWACSECAARWAKDAANG